MSKISVAVVGCGALAQVMHLPYLQRLDQFELVAVCDLSAKLACETAKRFHIPEWVTDYRQLITPQIQGILVLTGGSHGEICLEFAKAGKHIFVEKPLCYSPQEARALQEVANTEGICVVIGYMKRFDPGYRYAQQLLTDPQDVRYLQVTVLHPRESHYLKHQQIVRADDISRKTIETWVSNSRRLAKDAIGDVDDGVLDFYTNVLLGSLIHDINATRHLVGEPDRVLSANVWAKRQAVSVDLQFSNGIVGHYSWCYFDDANAYSEKIGVYSEGQRITLDFPSPYLQHAPTPVTVENSDADAMSTCHVVVNYEEAFEQELLHFHACVSKKALSLTPIEDGLQDILVLKAVAQTIISGTPQSILDQGSER